MTVNNVKVGLKYGTYKHAPAHPYILMNTHTQRDTRTRFALLATFALSFTQSLGRVYTQPSQQLLAHSRLACVCD